MLDIGKERKFLTITLTPQQAPPAESCTSDYGTASKDESQPNQDSPGILFSSADNHNDKAQNKDSDTSHLHRSIEEIQAFILLLWRERVTSPFDAGSLAEMRLQQRQ